MMATFSSDHTDTVTRAPLSGSDQHGDPTLGAQESIACVYRTDTNLLEEQGTTVDTVDVFETHTEIAPTDRIWPPDANTSDTSEARRIARVEQGVDLETGASLYRVTLE